MKIIDQNMLDVTEGVIVHQVNTSGVMGAGIARAIAQKWPEAEAKYVELVRTVDNPDLLLGFVQWYTIEDGLILANLFGQHLGVHNNRPTRYDATVDGWTSIANNLRFLRDNLFPDLKVYLPYGMGCGLGGGDWTVYSAIVDAIVPDAIACRI